MQRNNILRLFGPVVGTFTFSAVCFAQSFADVPGGAQGLDEVVVTAQRRTENVQNVPISVDRISSAQLEESRITQPVDLSRAVAGLLTNNATSDSTPIFAIRGIGLDDGNLNNSSGVGLYLDDVYQSSPVFLVAPFFDVDHVEVLKGPQGTLYGRNTTGGAISVVSVAPSESPDGYVSVGYGRWNTLDAEGAVGGPIGGALRARISGTLTTQGTGWQTDIDTGRHFGETRRGAVRVQVAATLSPAVQMLFSFHHAQDRSIPQSPQSPNAEQAINSIYGLIPGVSSYFTTPIAGLLNGTGDPARVRVGSISPFIHSKTDGGSMKLTAELPGAQLMSLTAYDSNSTTGLDNYDGIPTAEFNYARSAHAKQFSEEVRVTSSTAGRVDWVAGAVYGTDRLVNKDSGDVSFILLGTLDPQPGPGQIATDYRQTTTSYGAFGNAQIHVTPFFDAIAGLRYSHDERRFVGISRDLSGLYTGGPPGTPTAVLDESHATQNFSYRIALDYHVAPNAMLYGSFSTGYKAGGYYGAIGVAQAAWGYVDPERVATSEVGVKSRLWADRGQLNIAAFHTKYTNRQSDVTVIGPGGFFVTSLGSVPRSKIDGIELETAWKLGSGFDLRTAATYLSSSITETISEVRGLPLALPLAAGSQLAHAPKWSTNSSIGYRAPGQIAGYGFSVRAEYSWNSRSLAYIGDPQGEYGPNRSLGAHVEIKRADGRLAWTVWATNLTNSRDMVYSFTDPLTERVAYYQKPRAYGVRFRFSMP